MATKKEVPAKVLSRLAREACELLVNDCSTPSQREIARAFLSDREDHSGVARGQADG